MNKNKKRVCPKCGSECNAIEHSLEKLYVFCLDVFRIGCNYQTIVPKHKTRNGLIHEIKEAYKET